MDILAGAAKLHVCMKLHSKGRRRRLRRVKDISAFNFAQHLASEGKIESFNIPESVKPLVKKFLVTFSGNYLIEMNTN